MNSVVYNVALCVRSSTSDTITQSVAISQHSSVDSFSCSSDSLLNVFSSAVCLSLLCRRSHSGELRWRGGVDMEYEEEDESVLLRRAFISLLISSTSILGMGAGSSSLCGNWLVAVNSHDVVMSSQAARKEELSKRETRVLFCR